MIIEEGTVCPADARLICDYEKGVEGFQQYKVSRVLQMMETPSLVRLTLGTGRAERSRHYFAPP